jgi:hypothetical protein
MYLLGSSQSIWWVQIPQSPRFAFLEMTVGEESLIRSKDGEETGISVGSRILKTRFLVCSDAMAFARREVKDVKIISASFFGEARKPLNA